MRFAKLKLRTLYQVEFANSKKYKFQEEMNMAGTMSEKELRKVYQEIQMHQQWLSQVIQCIWRKHMQMKMERWSIKV